MDILCVCMCVYATLISKNLETSRWIAPLWRKSSSCRREVAARTITDDPARWGQAPHLRWDKGEGGQDRLLFMELIIASML